MRSPISWIITAGAATAMLGGCSTKAKEVYADHAWVRLAAVPGRPAAAYFTLHGGPAPATLIAVSTDVAVRGEMHETVAAGQRRADGAPAPASTMIPLARVAVAPQATVPFQPGARHVMLFGVNDVVKPGGTLTLTLTFADGTRILQDAGVIGAGDPIPT